MWRLRKIGAPRVNLRRLGSILATSLLVASFVSVFTTSTPALAVPAEWDGDTLTYEANQYSLDVDANLPDASTEGSVPYIWINEELSPQKAHVIFFATERPQNETSAELVLYDFEPPDSYSNPSSIQRIDVTVTLTGEQVDNATLGTTCDSSITSGVGWIICPLSNWIADGVDGLYQIINDFLEVPPVTADTGTGIYQLWRVLLTIANVCFAVVFLVIIYSHLTSIGFSNYNIKNMLPRLIIAAILVNISFWVCALAIDISNLLGHSINAIFINIRENLTTGADISWGSLTTFILSAGTIGSVAGFAAAVGGSWPGLGFLLIAALAGVAFSVFVAFVILAARQAIITVLLILSPLAFVAFVLPSTQDLFNRWRKSFTTLLLFFPIFAILFGGSGVAGAAIINNADGKLHIALIGLATQFMPLVLTPFLVQFSTGLLGRIAGLANNSTRGVTDRVKNWAHDNADYHASQKRARWAELAKEGNKRRFTNPAAMWGLNMDERKRQRENVKAGNEDFLKNRADDKWQDRLNNPRQGRWRGRSDRQHRQRAFDAHEYAEKARINKDQLHGEANEHWQRDLASNPEYAQLRESRRQTHLAKNRTNVLDERMTAADQRTYDELVASNAAGYEDIRQAKIETIEDTQHAQFQASEVEELGNRAFRAAFEDGVEGSRDLRQQNVRIENLKKESAAIGNTLQKRADADWERTSRTDGRRQTLRLRETEASDSYRLAESEYNTLIENIRAQGSDAPDLVDASAGVADSMKTLVRDIAVQESAITEAKGVQSTNLAEAYRDSQRGKDGGKLLRRAAGIGGQEGEIRAYSKAWKQLVGEITEEVTTARTITSDYSRDQLKTIMFKGTDPASGETVTNALRQAAMYELLQKKGNNQDAQEIRDAVAKMGLMQDKDGNYYEALRDSEGKLVLDAGGYAQIDRKQMIKDPEQIARRRDWQQFFDDAAGGSPHSMVTYSGTNKSAARSGLLVEDMRGGFYRDAIGGKFGPDKIFKADIDELKSLYHDMVDPSGYYSTLSDDQRQSVNKTFEAAILNLQGDPMKNPSIDDRNRGMMNEILARINPNYATRPGSHEYPVDEHQAIIPLDKRDEVDSSRTFTAPVTVSPPNSGYSYYTDRDIE